MSRPEGGRNTEVTWWTAASSAQSEEEGIVVHEEQTLQFKHNDSIWTGAIYIYLQPIHPVSSQSGVCGAQTHIHQNAAGWWRPQGTWNYHPNKSGRWSGCVHGWHDVFNCSAFLPLPGHRSFQVQINLGGGNTCSWRKSFCQVYLILISSNNTVSATVLSLLLLGEVTLQPDGYWFIDVKWLIVASLQIKQTKFEQKEATPNSLNRLNATDLHSSTSVFLALLVRRQHC